MTISKNKKTMTEAALRANKENAQKSTGAVTEEGKIISSMNALKHGSYAKRFWKIKGKAVGNLKICNDCGEDQKQICTSVPEEERSCLLHNELILRYVHTHQSGETKHIEEINMMQLATMDLLFTQKLRFAQMHMGEVEEYTNEETGETHKKPVIGNDYIYMLMNMMKTLSKSLPDMQLTKQTQENLDVEWAKLMEADIDPEKAAEYRNNIMTGMADFRKAHAKASEMEEGDEAIRQFEKNEEMANEDSDDIDIGDIGDSPFGQK